MKIFRNDICYVNIEDLLRCELPKYLVFDKVTYEKGDFVIFEDQKSIDYVKNRKDILDYDKVCFLDEIGLNLKIKEVEKILEPFILRWTNTPSKMRKDLYKDLEYVKNYTFYRDAYYDLVDYKSNREKIDNKINEIINQKVR